MKILVEDGRKVLSDAIASQADMHALYGGVVPEIASRKHVEVIAALTEQALRQAACTREDIDAVAVTYAPGLIGAVLVGLSFAKSVAFALGVPLIPVHHVRGHIAANYLAFPELEPPFLALAISGGNTLIVDVRDYTDLHILGATRDDAAGGVAANSIIRGDLERACAEAGCRLYLPPLRLCGDNGAMIGAQGYYEYLAGHTADMSLNAYATRAIEAEADDN